MRSSGGSENAGPEDRVYSCLGQSPLHSWLRGHDRRRRLPFAWLFPSSAASDKQTHGVGWGRGVENNRRRPWVRTAPAAAARNPHTGPALALRPRPAPHRARSIPRPPRASRSDSRLLPAAQLGLGSPGGPQPADTHIISVTDALHDHHRRRQLSAPPLQPPPPASFPAAAAAARSAPRRSSGAGASPAAPTAAAAPPAAAAWIRAPARRRGEGGREAGSCRRGRAWDPASPAALAERKGGSGSASGRALTADSAQGPGRA